MSKKPKNHTKDDALKRLNAVFNNLPASAANTVSAKNQRKKSKTLQQLLHDWEIKLMTTFIILMVLLLLAEIYYIVQESSK